MLKYFMNYKILVISFSVMSVRFIPIVACVRISFLFRLNNIPVYLFIHSFIHSFMAALGLCCCTWAFSSCGERGLLFVAVRGLLIVVASLVAEHGL